MSATRPDLVSLLGSRICHDLISPLGAIGNGLELLEMAASGAQGPEMQLISESAASANARIRFFRIAFGLAGTDQTVPRGELVSILEDTYRAGRIGVRHEIGSDVARTDAKLTLLLLLCVEAALPAGGEIKISLHDGRWMLGAAGPKLKIDDRLWTALTDRTPPEGLTAAEVQFALLPDAAADADRKLNVTLTDDSIDIRY